MTNLNSLSCSLDEVDNLATEDEYTEHDPLQTIERSDDNEIVYDRKVVLTLITGCLINFADVVELYLPGVLQQAITCDMDLTEKQHQLLYLALYGFYILGTFLSRFCANQIGRKKAILLSLCCSMVVSLTAALSHNFWMLLISRGCTGFLVGSNLVLVTIYWGEVAPNKKTKSFGMFMLGMSVSVGSGYTPFLAYFTLDLYGWRTFFLICTLPIYILPILSVIFFLEDTKYERLATKEETGKDMMTRTIKLIVFLLTLLHIINMFHSFASILFLPKIYQEENALKETNIAACNSVFGDQFLKMALIWGLGRPTADCVSYVAYLWGHSIPALISSSFLTTAGFIFMTTIPITNVEMDITWGVVAFSYRVFNTMFWIYLISADIFIVDAVRANALFIIDGFGKFGAIAGTTLVGLLAIGEMGVCMGVLGVIQVVSVIVMAIIMARIMGYAGHGLGMLVDHW